LQQLLRRYELGRLVGGKSRISSNSDRQLNASEPPRRHHGPAAAAGASLAALETGNSDESALSDSATGSVQEGAEARSTDERAGVKASVRRRTAGPN